MTFESKNSKIRMNLVHELMAIVDRKTRILEHPKRYMKTYRTSGQNTIFIAREASIRELDIYTKFP
jgi:hypothetical protein